MKNLILISFLSIFIMCNSQKKSINTTHETNDKIMFSSENIFYSNSNGGTQRPSFSIINNQEELNIEINNNTITKTDDSKNTKNFLDYPENQKVIKYNLGEFRSGNHTPKKIEYYKINNDTLEIYIKKNNNTRKKNINNMIFEVDIQIVTRPYIIFSIPKNITFQNIELKYE